MKYPARVKIVDVSPRDGLQNEKGSVPTEVRIELVDRLTDAGLQSVETGSFVSPKWVPQMADSAQVMARIRRKPGVAYPVLVPNLKGLEAAIAAGATEVAGFAAATEAFSKRNTNCTIAQSMQRQAEVCKAAFAAGVRVRGYISVVLGCPYEGEVKPQAVADVARQLQDMGCYEISLGDTIGIGTPYGAAAMVRAVAAEVPIERIAVHFHDTRGQALANIYASLEAGVRSVDASVAGLGGCPYAAGASGNVATEDLVYMLDGMGLHTGVDLDALIDTARWINTQLKRQPASRLARIPSRRVET